MSVHCFLCADMMQYYRIVTRAYIKQELIKTAQLAGVVEMNENGRFVGEWESGIDGREVTQEKLVNKKMKLGMGVSTAK